MATFEVGGKKREKYNRIRISIYPDCEGARSIYLNLIVENDGKIKVPDHVYMQALSALCPRKPDNF
jgi:hypothetical protein